nr:hypothetical protein [Tanacetum cinerariifolium]
IKLTRVVTWWCTAGVMAAVDGDDDCGGVAEPQWGVTGWRRDGGSVVGCGGSGGLPAVG